MTFHRNDITPSRPLDFAESYTFSSIDEGAYPLLSIESASLKGQVLKIDGILHVMGHLEAKLLLSDARTLEKVPYHLSKDVDFDLLTSEEEEGDGYVFPENRIDLQEVAYCLIITYMPKAYSKQKALPSGGEGYVVYREGDENLRSSPFDALNPDDFA